MQRAMDTAVTAFRNGKVLATVGHFPWEILAYRRSYIIAYDTGAEPDVEAPYWATIAYEDAMLDRETADA